MVEDCLEACFVRSFEAHGLINSVDVSAATEVDGVVAAYGAAELHDLPDVPFGGRGEPPAGMTRPALARERVRFAGEPIAVVVARDRYAAEDGAELVVADLESLPPVLDPTAAAAADSPRLFAEVGNVAAQREFGAPVTEVIETAPVVVTMTIRNERLVPTSIEARAVLAVPEEDGGLTIWVSHQAPHRLQRELAAALGVDPAKIRVVVPKVGGAFGAKSQTFPEFVVVAHLARVTGRAVRWIEDRREALQGATQGRGQTQHLRLAADAEGRMIALEAFIDADIGAYPHTGAFVPAMTGWVLSGPYEIPHLYARVRSVVTNATPTAPYRGAGRPEAAFALERLVDALARRLEMDPIELRIANFIAPSDFPYQSPTGALYDSGDYRGALHRARELAGYEALRAEQRRRRSSGEDRLLGIGVASWVERSGGQSGTHEFGAVEVNEDGTIVARSGSTSQGQGHETVFAQVVASAFGVDLERVRVVQGDTGEVPDGFGTFGSRSMQVGGSALQQASAEVIEEAMRRALRELEVAEEDLVYSGGVFRVAGTDRSIDVAQLATHGPLTASVKLAPPQAFPFGSYIAVVEIERDSGAIDLGKLIAVDDCGVVVNPRVVRGQIMGSITQGLGQALYERVSYDEWGQPLFGSLMDYSLPTLSEVPEIILGESVTPNPNVPLGTKGAGESGCIGAPPAVVNAIADALEGAAEDLDMPVTPEKVWRALAGTSHRSRRGGSPGDASYS